LIFLILNIFSFNLFISESVSYAQSIENNDDENESDNLINDENKVSDFEKAIFSSDLKKMKELVKNGLDINEEDKITGLTPLTTAIIIDNDYSTKDKIAMIKLIIELGANVNQETPDGKNPLGIAKIIAQDPEEDAIVKILIDAGAVEKIEDSLEFDEIEEDEEYIEDDENGEDEEDIEEDTKEEDQADK
jgi:ankyrin repeat protein